MSHDAFTLESLVAVGGNSRAARSARARLQWRDRFGRFVEMGRGVKFKVRFPNGKVSSVIGQFVGSSDTPNMGQVYVENDPNGLRNGFYEVSSSNGGEILGTLDDDYLAAKGIRVGYGADGKPVGPRTEQSVQDVNTMVRRDAPLGWKPDPLSAGGYITDDGDFKITKSRGQNGAAQFQVSKADGNGNYVADRKVKKNVGEALQRVDELEGNYVPETAPTDSERAQGRADAERDGVPAGDAESEIQRRADNNAEQLAGQRVRQQQIEDHDANNEAAAEAGTSILDDVQKNGQMVLDLDTGDVAKDGYLVPTRGNGRNIPEGDFFDPAKGPDALAKYVYDKRDVFGKSGTRLAIWHDPDNGNVRFDAVEQIPDANEAFGRNRNRPVYDVANDRMISPGENNEQSATPAPDAPAEAQPVAEPDNAPAAPESAPEQPVDNGPDSVEPQRDDTGAGEGVGDADLRSVQQEEPAQPAEPVNPEPVNDLDATGQPIPGDAAGLERRRAALERRLDRIPIDSPAYEATSRALDQINDRINNPNGRQEQAAPAAPAPTPSVPDQQQYGGRGSKTPQQSKRDSEVRIVTPDESRDGDNRPTPGQEIAQRQLQVEDLSDDDLRGEINRLDEAMDVVRANGGSTEDLDPRMDALQKEWNKRADALAAEQTPDANPADLPDAQLQDELAQRANLDWGRGARPEREEERLKDLANEVAARIDPENYRNLEMARRSTEIPFPENGLGSLTDEDLDTFIRENKNVVWALTAKGDFKNSNRVDENSVRPATNEKTRRDLAKGIEPKYPIKGPRDQNGERDGGEYQWVRADDFFVDPEGNKWSKMPSNPGPTTRDEHKYMGKYDGEIPDPPVWARPEGYVPRAEREQAPAADPVADLRNRVEAAKAELPAQPEGAQNLFGENIAQNRRDLREDRERAANKAVEVAAERDYAPVDEPSNADNRLQWFDANNRQLGDDPQSQRLQYLAAHNPGMGKDANGVDINVGDRMLDANGQEWEISSLNTMQRRFEGIGTYTVMARRIDADGNPLKRSTRLNEKTLHHVGDDAPADPNLTADGIRLNVKTSDLKVGDHLSGIDSGYITKIEVDPKRNNTNNLLITIDRDGGETVTWSFGDNRTNTVNHTNRELAGEATPEDENASEQVASNPPSFEAVLHTDPDSVDPNEPDLPEDDLAYLRGILAGDEGGGDSLLPDGDGEDWPEPDAELGNGNVPDYVKNLMKVDYDEAMRRIGIIDQEAENYREKIANGDDPTGYYQTQLDDNPRIRRVYEQIAEDRQRMGEGPQNEDVVTGPSREDLQAGVDAAQERLDRAGSRPNDGKIGERTLSPVELEDLRAKLQGTLDNRREALAEYDRLHEKSERQIQASDVLDNAIQDALNGPDVDDTGDPKDERLDAAAASLDALMDDNDFRVAPLSEGREDADPLTVESVVDDVDAISDPDDQMPDGPDTDRSPATPGSVPEDIDFGYADATEDYDDMKFPPTPEQRDVVQAVLGGNNVAVQALAGTGKTSTLELIANRLQKVFPQKRVIYVAFNKSVQEEAEGRMPGNVESRTGDSIAWNGISRNLTKKSRNRDALVRPSDIADHLGIRGDRENDPADIARGLDAVIKNYAISEDDDFTKEHFDKAGLEFNPTNVAYARAWWKDINDENGQIRFRNDHATKIWALTRPDLSKQSSGVRNPADIVFFDEAQDINPVMAKVIRDQSIQKVYVGDQNQAIYGFRGAVDELAKAEVDFDLPLTKSWRFGPQVAGMGNRFLKLLKARHKVVGGGADGIIHEPDTMEDADAVLTRSNAGAINAIIEELGRGRVVGVSEKFKEELTNVVNTARWLQNPGFRKPSKIADDFAGYKSWDEVERDVARDKADQKVVTYYNLVKKYGSEGLQDALDRTVVTAAKDNANNGGGGPLSNEEGAKGDLGRGLKYEVKDGQVLISGNTFPNKDRIKQAGFNKWNKDAKAWSAPANGALAKLQALRGDEEAQPKIDVVVTTAHKAKGLEWDKVRIANDFRGPEPIVDPDTGEERITMPSDEELRLAYVAVTRAARELDPGSLNWIRQYTNDEDEDPNVPTVTEAAPDAPEASPEAPEAPREATPAPEASEAPEAPQTPVASEPNLADVADDDIDQIVNDNLGGDEELARAMRDARDSERARTPEPAAEPTPAPAPVDTPEPNPADMPQEDLLDEIDRLEEIVDLDRRAGDPDPGLGVNDRLDDLKAERDRRAADNVTPVEPTPDVVPEPAPADASDFVRAIDSDLDRVREEQNNDPTRISAPAQASAPQDHVARSYLEGKDLTPEERQHVEDVLDNGNSEEVNQIVESLRNTPNKPDAVTAPKRDNPDPVDLEEDLVSIDPLAIADPNRIVADIKKNHPDYKTLENGDLVLQTRQFGNKKYDLIVRRTGREQFFAYIRQTNADGSMQVVKLGEDSHSYRALSNKMDKGKRAMRAGNPAGWFNRQRNRHDIASGDAQGYATRVDDFNEGIQEPRSRDEAGSNMRDLIGRSIDNPDGARAAVDAAVERRNDGNPMHPAIEDEIVQNGSSAIIDKAQNDVLNKQNGGDPAKPYVAYGGEQLQVGDWVDWTVWDEKSPYYGQVFRAQVKKLRPYANNNGKHGYTDHVYVVAPEYARLMGWNKPNSKRIERVSSNLRVVDGPEAPIGAPFFAKREEKARQVGNRVDGPSAADFGVPAAPVGGGRGRTVKKPRNVAPKQAQMKDASVNQFGEDYVADSGDMPLHANDQLGMLQEALAGDVHRLEADEIRRGDILPRNIDGKLFQAQVVGREFNPDIPGAIDLRLAVPMENGKVRLTRQTLRKHDNLVAIRPKENLNPEGAALGDPATQKQREKLRMLIRERQVPPRLERRLNAAMDANNLNVREAGEFIEDLDNRKFRELNAPKPPTAAEGADAGRAIADKMDATPGAEEQGAGLRRAADRSEQLGEELPNNHDYGGYNVKAVAYDDIRTGGDNPNFRDLGAIATGDLKVGDIFTPNGFRYKGEKWQVLDLPSHRGGVMVYRVIHMDENNMRHGDINTTGMYAGLAKHAYRPTANVESGYFNPKFSPRVDPTAPEGFDFQPSTNTFKNYETGEELPVRNVQMVAPLREDIQKSSILTNNYEKGKKILEGFKAGFKGLGANNAGNGIFNLRSQVLRLKNGDLAFIKVLKQKDDMDSEVLSNRIAQALGIKGIEMIDLDDGETLLTQAIPGENAADKRAEYEDLFKPGNFEKSFNAKRIGLLDYIIGNEDRHLNNWRIAPDGEPYPIDHGMTTLGRDNGEGGSDRTGFVKRALGGSQGGGINRPWQFSDDPDDIKFTEAELLGFRQRIEEIREEFESRDKGDWYDRVLRRLDRVITAKQANMDEQQFRVRLPNGKYSDILANKRLTHAVVGMGQDGKWKVLHWAPNYGDALNNAYDDNKFPGYEDQHVIAVEP